MLIDDIKALTDTNVRQKTLPGTITRTNDAQIRDDICEEIRVRGVIQAASTDELDEHSHTNTLLVLVQNVGFFVADETGASADNITTFDSFDSGWLWRKILDVAASTGKDTFTLTGDGTYTLTAGNMINVITIKPTTNQTQKVGLAVSGEEIMESTVLLANVTKPVQVNIAADGSSKTIYFSGITASTLFNIYKLAL